MKEIVLHYIWQHKLFAQHDLCTTNGQKVEVIDIGKPNIHAGPDFFNAKIKIGKTLWAGNIEIHKQSSDWNKHRHQLDPNYNNVILHVVRKVDVPVFRMDGQQVPQIELSYADEIEQNFQSLINTAKWIACEDKIKDISPIHLSTWKYALLTERVGQKVKEMDDLLYANHQHWEETFFVILCKHFGFAVNNDAFYRLARSIPWMVVYKCSTELSDLEALLFGQSGLLEQIEQKDDYTHYLSNEYAYLKRKFNLKPLDNVQWKMLRMRPDNFPYLRIAQLAALLHKKIRLFDYILHNISVDAYMDLFRSIELSDYWNNHYVLGESSVTKQKKIGKSSIYSLLINVIVPMIFCYGAHQQNQEMKDKALMLMEEIPAEQNRIVRQWKDLGIKFNTAADTQAFIHLYKNYCEEKKCLRCRIGHQVLTSKHRLHS